MQSTVEEAVADLEKLQQVIDSCETLEHLESALKMANLFVEKHGYGELYVAEVLARIDEARY